MGARATLSDERLVERVRAGDDEAFGVIYDRYAGSLLAFCHHMLGTHEEAEDALQQVFVAAHRQMRLGSPPQQLKPWLYAVARNRCLSVLRARHETVALDDVLAPAAAADVTQEAEQRSEIREVLADVAALPYEQREALILAEVGAMSHEEIALTLGVRKDKVKALVFQARQSLMVSREARETTCRDIQERLAVLRGGALRRGAIRRHVDRCPACAAFKSEVQRQRSLLAAALPVLPAAALKPTILAAVNAGASGSGIAATGAVAAVAATTGSSSAAGGGLAGLGASALLTKVLAAGAVAGVAVGGGAAIMRLPQPRDPAATPAPAAQVAKPTTPPTEKAARISVIAPTAVPPSRSSPEARDRRAGTSRAPQPHPGAAGDAEPSLTIGPTVTPLNGTAEVSRGEPYSAPTAPEVEARPATPATLGGAPPGVRSGQADSAQPQAPAAQSGSAEPESPPGQANDAEPQAPPGQAKNARPQAPPGQADNAKPQTPPGQADNPKPQAPPGQAKNARPQAPPGQADNAEPQAPPGQADNARPQAPPGQASDATPDAPPGQKPTP